MIANTEIRKIECEQGVLEYQLIRKQVKNVNLRIRPNGQIFISANTKVPVEFIDDFIIEKQKYIFRALKSYEGNHRHIPTEPRQYVSGENFDVLGKSLRLKVVQGKLESVLMDGVFVILTVRNKDNQKHKENLINNWLKDIQFETYNQICNEVHQIFKKYDVEYPTIKIRCMTSRWGSCQPRKGIITLNSRLIEAPRNCIEYVILHEFVHFIHPNHSKRFYDFVAMLMPDWKDRKMELEKRI